VSGTKAAHGVSDDDSGKSQPPHRTRPEPDQGLSCAMSIANILAATRSKRPATERLVWSCLISHANGAGWWPMTDKAIAAELHISLISVRRAVAALVRDGVIWITRHRRRPTVFHVTPPNGPDHADLSAHFEHQTPQLSAHFEHSTTRESAELSAHFEHTARAGLESKKRKITERKKSISIKPRSRLDAATAPPGFAEFWQAYPRKVGKRAAMKAFALALKRTDAPTILAGLARAQPHFNPETQYQPHPTTWLNQDRWLDEHDPVDPVLRALGITELPEYDDIFTTPIPKGRLQ